MRREFVRRCCKCDAPSAAPSAQCEVVTVGGERQTAVRGCPAVPGVRVSLPRLRFDRQVTRPARCGGIALRLRSWRDCLVFSACASWRESTANTASGFLTFSLKYEILLLTVSLCGSFGLPSTWWRRHLLHPWQGGRTLRPLHQRSPWDEPKQR